MVLRLGHLFSAYLDQDETVSTQRVEEAVQLGHVGEVGVQGGPTLVIRNR